MHRLTHFKRPTLRDISTLLNRLWVQLAIASLVVVVIGIAVTMIIDLIFTMQKISETYGEDVWTRELTYQFTQEDGVVETLEQYYRQYGNWEGIAGALLVVQSFNPPTERESLSYSFTTVDGEVLFDTHPENLDDWITTAFDATYPIEVDGAVRGYLRAVYVNQFADFATFNSYDEFFMLSLESWLEDRGWLMVVVGVTAGTLLGVVFSRTLAAPLRRLAQAAQAVGSRDLSKRVDVKGSTEVKQLAQAFNDMAAKLEHAEALRRNLVADIAHELRTPITVLQGNLRAMLDDVYPMSKEEVAALYDQTRLLSRLVNDLHEVAQAEARKLPLNKRPLDMVTVVQRVLATFKPILDGEEIRLRIKLPDHLPIQGDEGRLSQVLHNLLSNASYHTPPGGLISITAWTERDCVGLSVRDTGKGIPEEHLPFIFERFYRVDRSRSRNKGGVGLGLAIARAIVEAHDGKIWAESQGIPGSGTTLTVMLPLDMSYTGTITQATSTSEIPVLA